MAKSSFFTDTGSDVELINAGVAEAVAAANASSASAAAAAASAVTAASFGGVPTTRTVNGHALSANVTLNQSDISFTGLTAAGAVADTDALPVNQGAGNLKQTYAAVKTWIKAWITKTDVALGNVDNTSDANKPVSTAQATALALKAPIASPAFTGTASFATGGHVILSSPNTFGTVLEYQNNGTAKWGTLNAHSGDGFGTNFWCLYNYVLANAAVKFDPSNNNATFSSVVASSEPVGSGLNFQSTVSTGSVANGGNTILGINGVGGLVFVREATAVGTYALYMVGTGSAIMIANSGGTDWIAPTTTPAAGKMSVAYDGSAYRLYNNRGGASNFNVLQMGCA
jgi:hypothetical protein